MIISKTPLRISFFGGGTDFREFYRAYGGAVLSAAIDKYVYVCVNKRFDDKVRVSYSRTEIVDKASGLQHDIVRTALEMFGIEHGIEIVTIADVSGEGTGLGSSSALAVGLVNALLAYTGEGYVLPDELACRACQIEIDMLHRPIGEQDQMIAAHGGLRYFLWGADGQCGQSDYRAMADGLQSNLMLLHLGRARDADAILVEMRANLDANSAMMFTILNSVARGVEYLTEGNWQRFGELVGEMWWCKCSLSTGISTPEINVIYQRALDAGAWGGKVCGAGGGGYLLLCAPSSMHSAIREALGLKELRVSLGVEGARVMEV